MQFRRFASLTLCFLFSLVLLLPFSVRAADPPLAKENYVDFLSDSVFSVDGVAQPGYMATGFTGTKELTFQRSGNVVLRDIYLVVNAVSAPSITLGSAQPTDVLTSGARYYYHWRGSFRSNFLRFWVSFETNSPLYILDCTGIGTVTNNPFTLASATRTLPDGTSATFTPSAYSAWAFTTSSNIANPGLYSTSVLLQYDVSNYPWHDTGGIWRLEMYVNSSYVLGNQATLSPAESTTIVPEPAISGLSFYAGTTSWQYSLAVVPDISYEIVSAPDAGLDCRIVASLDVRRLSPGTKIWVSFDLLPFAGNSFSVGSGQTLNFRYAFGLDQFGLIGGSETSNSDQVWYSWYQNYIDSIFSDAAETFVTYESFSGYMERILDALAVSVPSVSEASVNISSAASAEDSLVSAGVSAADSITSLQVPSTLVAARPVFLSVSQLFANRGPLLPLFTLLVLLPLSVGIIAKLLNGGD